MRKLFAIALIICSFTAASTAGATFSETCGEYGYPYPSTSQEVEDLQHELAWTADSCDKGADREWCQQRADDLGDMLVSLYVQHLESAQ
jgi:hypothetical protein